MTVKCICRACRGWECGTLFAVGGFLYLIIEIMARGWTHWSMFFVGGVCFVLIGLLNQHCCRCRETTSLLGQMAAGAFIISAVEFVAGCVLNLWLGLGVWDYSAKPYNLLGQVNLETSVLWFLLSLPAILLDDGIRRLFGEPWPEYHVM